MSNAKDLLGKAGTSGPSLPKPTSAASGLTTPPDETKESKHGAVKDAKPSGPAKPQSQNAVKTTGTVRPKV